MARILIIDDDAAMLVLMRQMLVQRGHEVACAADGLQGQIMARNKPELVILDYQMPAVDGAQALSWVRIAAENDKLPVIFVTAQSLERVKAKLPAVAHVAFHRKPVDIKVLDAQIRDLIAGA